MSPPMRAHQNATFIASAHGMRVGCPASVVGIDPGRNARNPINAPSSAPTSTNWSPFRITRQEGFIAETLQLFEGVVERRAGQSHGRVRCNVWPPARVPVK